MYLEKNKLSLLYKVAKKKSEQKKSTIVFSFTQEIKLSNNFISLIDIELGKSKKKSYWGQKNKNREFISFGETFSLNTDNLDKSFINLNIEKIINDNVNFNETKQNNIPIFIGGQNFDINKTNIDIWRKYKSVNYQIPEILILKSDNQTTITFFTLMNKPFNSIYSKCYDYYKAIEDYSDNQKKSKMIFKSEGIKTDKNKFIDQVAYIKDKIKKKKVRKVVLSNIYKYSIKKEGTYSLLLESMIKEYPECTIFYFDYLNEGKFLGASPELVLKNTNNNIEIDALAGSINNGKTISEQKENEKKLYESKKINDEHDIVIKGIKKSLLENNIKIKCGKKHVLKLKNIQHLKTSITAIKNDMKIMDILNTLSPTPALSGYPKNKSIDIINDIEDFDRGWYSGTIGYISNNLNAEFYAGLRSAYINDEYIYIYAGAGITIDSNEDEEWLEIKNKMNAIDQIINE
tara:strand:+ start:9598 stop:10977 length:1380 start_codon:yes stop_codon:yes gene_type:complete